MILTYIKFSRKAIQRQVFIEMLFNILRDVLVQGKSFVLSCRMQTFVDHSVQMKDQIVDGERNLGFFSKFVRLHFLDQAKCFGLHRIEGYPVIVVQISVCCLHMVHKIYIIRRNLGKIITIFLTDPEDKSPVRNFRTVDDRVVVNVRGNQHNVTKLNWINIRTNLDTDITFQKKIEFIVIVSMIFYF